MEFSGEIEDLPLIDLLQYLYAGKKTGTLILGFIEQKWYIYFQNGEIVWASSQSSKQIEELLVDYKQIDVKTLHKTKALKAEHQEQRSISQMLVEMKLLSEDSLKKIKQAEMKQRMTRLSLKNRGEFSFKNNELINEGEVKIDPLDLLQTGDVNTQLLLEQILSGLKADEQEKPQMPEKHPDTQRQKETEETDKPQENLKETTTKPLEAAHSAEGHHSGATRSKTHTTSSDQQSKHPNIVILLVEDGILKNLLREAIQSPDIVLITPRTVEECLEKVEQALRQGITPLLLTDDRLPEVRRFGPALGDIILSKKKKHAWSCPVVIMTESSTPEMVWKFYQSGARVVLPKPVRQEKKDFLSGITLFGNVMRSLVAQTASGDAQNNQGVHEAPLKEQRVANSFK